MRFAKINPWFWDKSPARSNEPKNKGLSSKSAAKNGFEPRTELGKKLIEIREAAIVEGMQLKTLDELEKDNEERKGTIS
jgi:hypothetical protein